MQTEVLKGNGVITLKCAVVARERAADGHVLLKVRLLENPSSTQVELVETGIYEAPDKPLLNLLSRPLSEITWPPRVQEALAYESMDYLGDLCVTQEKRLRRHPGIGDKTINKVRSTLEDLNLTLGMNFPWWDHIRETLTTSPAQSNTPAG